MRGDSSISNRSKKQLHGIELSGADCQTCGACVAMARATLTDKGNSSVSRNAGATSGSVWNNGDTSEDKAKDDRFAQDQYMRCAGLEPEGI